MRAVRLGFIAPVTVLGVVFLVPVVASAAGETCTTHCDCPQTEFCYYGKCDVDPKWAVYCCSNPGCMPGQSCVTTSGAKGTCSEDVSFVCQDACDCGPAYACMTIQGSKTCVKDADDPWISGGTIFNVTVPAGEPTYCCGTSSCYAGFAAYSDKTQFYCYRESSGSASSFCGGDPCFYSGDCDAGESCADTRPNSPAEPGGSCNADGGYCVSNAAAESLFGYSSAEILPPCSSGCLQGLTCEAGWRPGGVHAVERVVGKCGSCGNGTCDAWETAKTCTSDCSCGDGVCDSTEPGVCTSDCGTCGDGTCIAWETPKTCPADCVQFSYNCGDGTCTTLEVTTCSTDCICPGSAYYWDSHAWCGDGECQRGSEIPEDCINCPKDCDAVTDTDGDGTPDGCDLCANDANKTKPGICGCGVSDVDTDSDGTADCQDGCPNDPSKTHPGGCGCGTPDVDSDFDGTPDCNDGCPSDPNKVAPGQCGCGAPDTDGDGDGIADCIDMCPADPLNDADSDGLCGEVDLCLGSVIPESVPTVELKVNRYAVSGAQVSGVFVFETKAPSGPGPRHLFTLEDTAGCTCEQILDQLVGPNSNQYRNGCSASVIETWMDHIGPLLP